MGRFNYNKAREEAEIMLKVLEREPPPRWVKSMEELIPLFYSIALTSIVMSSTLTVLKEDNKA